MALGLLEARVSVVVSIFVVINFTLAFVGFGIETQFLELSALGRRVLGVLVERAGQVLEIFKSSGLVGLFWPIHEGKGVIGCPLPIGLPTLIAPGVIASVVRLVACGEPLARSLFRCNHLLDGVLEVFSCSGLSSQKFSNCHFCQIPLEKCSITSLSVLS